MVFHAVRTVDLVSITPKNTTLSAPIPLSCLKAGREKSASVHPNHVRFACDNSADEDVYSETIVPSFNDRQQVEETLIRAAKAPVRIFTRIGKAPPVRPFSRNQASQNFWFIWNQYPGISLDFFVDQSTLDKIQCDFICHGNPIGLDIGMHDNGAHMLILTWNGVINCHYNLIWKIKRH